MQKKVRILLLFISILLIVIGSLYLSESEEVSANELEKEEIPSVIFIDIKGAVNNPGVYEMKYGDRIIDAINEAGGLKENADTSILNLSKKITDEMNIIIYTFEEIKEYKNKLIPPTKIIKEIEEKIICPDENNDACINKNYNNSLININTATKEELLNIPGIGEAKALDIIDYRNNNYFNSIEEITNVKGIGNSLYEKIKKYISV